MYHIYTKTPCASYLPAAVTFAFCSADGSCIQYVRGLRDEKVTSIKYT